MDEFVPKENLINYMWRHGNLAHKMHETQREIHQKVDDADSDELLVFSSRQLGKSYWATIYAIEYCIRNPGCIVRVLAATLKQVQDIVNDNLTPIMRDAPAGLVERQKSSYRWRIGESSLRLGPLERAYVDYNRGGNASLVICEEGGFIPSDDYEYAVRSVIGPQLLRSGGQLLHVTTPSEDPLHYIHTEVLPKTKLNDAFFHYTIYDNPQITNAQIEKAKELCGGEDSAAWKREYLAQIIRDPSSVIVPQFDIALHVKEFAVPANCHWFVSIDWGGVRDRTAGILYGYDFQRNKIIVYAEFDIPPNTPTSEVLAQCAAMEGLVEAPIKARWADVPGQLQVDLNKAQFETRLPIKDDWQAGINNMQMIFGRKEIEIFPTCKFLIQSLESGQYNKNRTDFNRSESLGHCDALAALMYGLRSVDKSSPFADIRAARSRTFTVHTNESKEQQIAKTIQPKVFGGSSGLKRFGAFKG